MSTPTRPGFAAVQRAVGAYARVDRAVKTVGHVARLVADGALGAALDDDEKMRLTVGLYDLDLRVYQPAGGLWDWEEAWLARRLPPAPARILIGAAGAGREAVARADRGYQVAAFEPAAQMCARAIDSAGGRYPVVRADYADLVDAVAGRNVALRSIVAEPWDAVLFGWTSLSHLLDPHGRARALAAASQLAPRGPILVSFVARLGTPGAPTSRIWRLARRVGSAAARLRGLDTAVNADGAQFDRSVGFVQPYAPEDLAAMGAALGRATIHEADPGFPHVTFAPT